MKTESVTRPETLVDAADVAGIKVPPNLHNYDQSDYPYWHLFCLTQIDRPMPHSDSHLKNARVIADIDPSRIGGISFRDIVDYLE